MHNAQLKKVDTAEQDNQRSAERQKLVLRLGLLEQEGRSIFCLVKNISSAGVQVKPYGRLSQKVGAALRISDEDPIKGTVVWTHDGLAGIEFEQALNPQVLLRIGQKLVAHKRRAAPRVATDLKGCLRTGGVKYTATIRDLSMVGARISTVQPVTFGEAAIIEVPGLPSLRAYVRWSDGAEHGLSFQTPLPMQVIADLLSDDASLQLT